MQAAPWSKVHICVQWQMNWASEMEPTYIKIWGFAINKKDTSLFLHSVFSSRLNLKLNLSCWTFSKISTRGYTFGWTPEGANLSDSNEAGLLQKHQCWRSAKQPEDAGFVHLNFSDYVNRHGRFTLFCGTLKHPWKHPLKVREQKCK